MPEEAVLGIVILDVPVAFFVLDEFVRILVAVIFTPDFLELGLFIVAKLL
jgi:hypothetical protein